MESHSEKDSNQQVCWFCKKGRHSECMIEIPIDQNPRDQTIVLLIPR